jgi:hypothetical protein
MERADECVWMAREVGWAAGCIVLPSVVRGCQCQHACALTGTRMCAWAAPP